MNIPLACIVLLNMFKTIFCLNILGIVSFSAKSHFLVVSKLFRSLAEKGHNVTVISHYPWRNSSTNYRDVEIGNKDEFEANLKLFSDFENIKTNRLYMYLAPALIASSGHTVCELTFQSRSVQNFLNEKQNFDVILMEDFLLECLWPMAQKFDCAVIRFVPHSYVSWSGRKLGNPLGSSYLPNLWLAQNDGKSFFGRLERYILTCLHNLYFEYSVIPEQMKIAEKYLQVDDMTFDDGFFNESLKFINSHCSINSPRPLVPNLIEIGGIHIEEPRALPKVSIKYLCISSQLLTVIRLS